MPTERRIDLSAHIMSMRIEPVAATLHGAGFDEPTLNALVWDATKYEVLMLQPQGDLEASEAGVWSHDRDLARQQFGGLLAQAQATQPDLLLTPEYSMPWDILEYILAQTQGPDTGKLWALGCESIRTSELAELRVRLAEKEICVLYEDLPAHEPEKFVSPLAYVFVAPSQMAGQQPRTVLLVQFKTHPMGGTDFERDGMACGSCIYKFGGGSSHIALLSLICADAFAFTDELAQLHHHQALILHLQLNPQPRHTDFHECRYRLLHYTNDVTEVICLNWAANVKMRVDDQPSNWKNIAGSAWYLKSKQYDDNDTIIKANHLKGLYYTWLERLRAHALFFNYNATIYAVSATKVVHVGVAGSAACRTGPKITRAFRWHAAEGAWEEQHQAEDGFADIVAYGGAAEAELIAVAARNPMEVERILALGAGKIGHDNWHHLKQLDSCALGADEVVCRVTFAQDTHEKAEEFRTSRLRHFSQLWDILGTHHALPPALADFKDGIRLVWSKSTPHQNIISGSEKRATAIYVGSLASVEKAEKIFQQASYRLERDFPEADARSTAKQRLVVWYHNKANQLTHHNSHAFVQFDQPDNVSEVAINR